jgi:hypothetical protein
MKRTCFLLSMVFVGLGCSSAAPVASHAAAVQDGSAAAIVRAHRTGDSVTVTKGFFEVASQYPVSDKLVNSDFCFLGKAEDACTALTAEAKGLAAVTDFTCKVALESRVDVEYKIDGTTFAPKRRIQDCGGAQAATIVKGTTFADEQVQVLAWPTQLNAGPQTGETLCYLGNPADVCESFQKGVESLNQFTEDDGYAHFEKVTCSTDGDTAKIDFDYVTYDLSDEDKTEETGRSPTSYAVGPCASAVALGGQAASRASVSSALSASTATLDTTAQKNDARFFAAAYQVDDVKSLAGFAAVKGDVVGHPGDSDEQGKDGPPVVEGAGVTDSASALTALEVAYDVIFRADGSAPGEASANNFAGFSKWEREFEVVSIHPVTAADALAQVQGFAAYSASSDGSSDKAKFAADAKAAVDTITSGTAPLYILHWDNTDDTELNTLASIDAKTGSIVVLTTFTNP